MSCRDWWGVRGFSLHLLESGSERHGLSSLRPLLVTVSSLALTTNTIHSFDGCANTCLDSPPSKPSPTAASTTPSPRPGTAPAVTTWRPAYSTEDGGYLYHAPPPEVPSLYGPPHQG